MTLTARQISDLLTTHGVHPSRALGQNFVTDPNTVRRIARLADVGPGDRVLEIGPGLGSLTLALAETGAAVTAVEVDHHLLPALQAVLGPADVRVVQGDAMRTDWSELLGPQPGWVMVANLPYNIATPLVADLLDDVPTIDRMLFMVQREVGERLVALPGHSEYGAVSVKIAYWAEASIVGRVPATVFVPRPKVESVLVSVRRRVKPAIDPDRVSAETMFALVRAGFGKRRKMLRRSLSGLVPAGAFEAAEVNPESRAENLDVYAWGRLAAAVAEAAASAPADAAEPAGVAEGAGVVGEEEAAESGGDAGRVGAGPEVVEAPLKGRRGRAHRANGQRSRSTSEEPAAVADEEPPVEEPAAVAETAGDDGAAVEVASGESPGDEGTAEERPDAVEPPTKGRRRGGRRAKRRSALSSSGERAATHGPTAGEGAAAVEEPPAVVEDVAAVEEPALEEPAVEESPVEETVEGAPEAVEPPARGRRGMRRRRRRSSSEEPAAGDGPTDGEPAAAVEDLPAVVEDVAIVEEPVVEDVAIVEEPAVEEPADAVELPEAFEPPEAIEPPARGRRGMRRRRGRSSTEEPAPADGPRDRESAAPDEEPAGEVEETVEEVAGEGTVEEAPVAVEPPARGRRGRRRRRGMSQSKDPAVAEQAVEEPPIEEAVEGLAVEELALEELAVEELAVEVEEEVAGEGTVDERPDTVEPPARGRRGRRRRRGRSPSKDPAVAEQAIEEPVVEEPVLAEPVLAEPAEDEAVEDESEAVEPPVKGRWGRARRAKGQRGTSPSGEPPAAVEPTVEPTDEELTADEDIALVDVAVEEGPLGAGAAFQEEVTADVWPKVESRRLRGRRAKGRHARSGSEAPPDDGSRPVTVEARAKLTLSLRITGVRPDGYHLIDAEMVTLDLADRLELGPGDGLEVAGPRAATVPAGEDNLVRRALWVTGRKAFVRLHKEIPSGAGLGGGSADAAAVLRWAGVTDPSVALQLGADVPFCLVGGRARVRGVGEQVDPLPFEDVAGGYFTLLTPPFGVFTPLVYRAWDRLGGPTGDGPNDLERAALQVEPGLAEWRDRLGDATGETPVLAGSGGTWFVAGAFPGDGRVVVRVAR